MNQHFGKKITHALAACCALLAALPAQQLEPGATPPAFALSEMVRGAPVAKLAPGKVHLIEFWGSEAGTGFDRAQEFHALQKKHGDKLVVTGVVGPDEESYDHATVAEYYAEHGAHLQFTIGFDGDGALHKAWLPAVGAEPPHVFLIDAAGKLAWSGGLGFLPIALPVVMKGDVDYAALKADCDAAEKKFMRLALVSALKPKATITELDELVKSWPALEPLAVVVAYNGLVDSDEPALALPLQGRVAKVFYDNGDADSLNGLAWSIVDPDVEAESRNLEVAEKAAKQAVELTKGEDGAVLDTLARVYFWKKDFAQAVKVQKQAVEKALDDEEREMYAAVLKEYEALAAGK